MDEYKCNLCSCNFKTKFSLDRHQNKKNACTMSTEFKCDKCNKCFKTNQNLKFHKTKDICKKNFIKVDQSFLKQNLNIEDALRDILTHNFSIDDKIMFIKKLNNGLLSEEIQKIINIDLHIDTKIILLKTISIPNNSQNNSQNNSNNNNSNNTINNIQINKFGKEDTSYLTDHFLKNLIKNNNCENILLKLSNEIYLNSIHPENHTVKIDNINNKLCKIKDNNKWIVSPREVILKDIYDKICIIIEDNLGELEDSIEEKKLKLINEYIEKEFEDEAIKDFAKKLAFNIYNFYITNI